MSSIWLSSCTRRGSILARPFLLQKSAAAAVARQGRRAEPQEEVAHLVEFHHVGCGRRGPVACQQPVAGRAGDEDDMSCRGLLIRPLRLRLLWLQLWL